MEQGGARVKAWPRSLLPGRSPVMTRAIRPPLLLLLLLLVLSTPCSAQPRQPLSLRLHESPYFLPNVTDQAEVFAADAVWPAGAYRVFGAASAGLGLGFAGAEQACRDVGGRGLAAVQNRERKAALDALITHTQRTHPGLGTFGCCAGQFWVGGFRTSLSDPQCVRSAVPHWPYFNSTATAEATDYAGCGKDPVYDWAWSTWDEANQNVFVMWRAFRGPEEWWETPQATGVGSSGQPTGWNGPLFHPALNPGDAGDYENCTAAKAYVQGSPESEGVFGNALDRAWYRDVKCSAPMERWVCEMESAEQGVDALAMAQRAAPGAAVRNSPFYMPGVTDLVRESVDRSVALRVFGVPPAFAARFHDDDATPKWATAQQACTAMGARGLAVSPSAALSAARSRLVRAVMPALDPATPAVFWIGGATAAAPATVAAPSAWTWFLDITIDRSGNIDQAQTTTIPMSPDHVPWDFKAGYPTPAAVDAAGKGPSGLSSCMVAAWHPEQGDRWQNRLCNDPNVTLFICAFDDAAEGMAELPTALPATLEAAIGGGSGGGPPAGALAGIVVAAAAVAMLVAGTAWFAVRRHRQGHDSERGLLARLWKSKKGGAAAGGLPTVCSRTSPLPPAASLYTTMAVSGAQGVFGFGKTTETGAGVFAAPAVTGSAAAGNGGTDDRWGVNSIAVLTDMTDNVSSMTRTPGATTTTRGASTAAASTVTSGAPAPASAGGGSSDSHTQIAHLTAQLDLIAKHDQPILNRYRLRAGPWERRQGGQGVVQFATGLYDGFDYAIKWFLRPAAFRAEHSLYRNEALRDVLPTISDIVDNADGSVTDPYGVPLPPCIIMERGEALDEWSRRAQPDMPTAVQVLSHLAERLCKIHAAGMVHRDLKPGNVVWLPRVNRWTIIDFGCAAPIGEPAPISFSLAYAAPEVIAAVTAQRAAMDATPALDAWSLGVMAFELLTQQRTFDARGQGSKALIVSQLRGEMPLPWEGAAMTPALRKQLGILRKPVLQLLARDPAARPTMAQFQAMCSAIFQSTTTVGSVDSAAGELQ